MTSLVRETFTSRFGTLMTMIGVAVGLGNVWRFPYMVGEFGGAAFVVLYAIIALAIGVPGLMAEWALGRHTRRGPVGAFAGGGLPFGRAAGWFFFFVVCAATAYYTAVVGWVLYFAVAGLAKTVVPSIHPAAILPPDDGFNSRSFTLQMVCTAAVILRVPELSPPRPSPAAPGAAPAARRTPAASPAAPWNGRGGPRRG